jgi:hypothetical protein
MATTTLYDTNTSAPAVIPRDDLTAEDISHFCEAGKLHFVAMGCPKDSGGTGWDDPTVFRAMTHDYPARGVTIKLDTVVEWKRAMESIGPMVASGGIYRHYEGGTYTTICEAREASTGERKIVFKDGTGAIKTTPWNEFFNWVKVDNRIIARVEFVTHAEFLSNAG